MESVSLDVFAPPTKRRDNLQDRLAAKQEKRWKEIPEAAKEAMCAKSLEDVLEYFKASDGGRIDAKFLKIAIGEISSCLADGVKSDLHSFLPVMHSLPYKLVAHTGVKLDTAKGYLWRIRRALFEYWTDMGWDGDPRYYLCCNPNMGLPRAAPKGAQRPMPVPKIKRKEWVIASPSLEARRSRPSGKNELTEAMMELAGWMREQPNLKEHLMLAFESICQELYGTK